MHTTSGLDWAVVLLVAATLFVGVAAIINAVRVNKLKHGEVARSTGKHSHAVG